MIGLLRAILRLVPQAPADVESLSEDVAIAGLFVEAARRDGDYADDQKSMADRWLKDHFNISLEQAKRLRLEAEAAIEQTMTIYGFAAKSRACLSKSDREALYKELKRITMSDEVIHAREDDFLKTIESVFAIEV